MFSSHFVKNENRNVYRSRATACVHLDGRYVEMFEEAESRRVSERYIHKFSVQQLQIHLYQMTLKNKHLTSPSVSQGVSDKLLPHPNLLSVSLGLSRRHEERRDGCQEPLIDLHRHLLNQSHKVPGYT